YASGPELGAVEQLLSARREIGAIMATNELTTEVLQAALRSGIKDVLQLPVESQELAEAVSRVAGSLTVSVPAVAGSGGPVLEADGDLGQVITVFSTKGGAGKSVIASNLAVVLAQRSPKPVVLIDADLQFGDVAVMLKLSPQHTIVDAVSALDRLDAQ